MFFFIVDDVDLSFQSNFLLHVFVKQTSSNYSVIHDKIIFSEFFLIFDSLSTNLRLYRAQEIQCLILKKIKLTSSNMSDIVVICFYSISG